MSTALQGLIDEVRLARELTTPRVAREIRRAAGVTQERLALALEVDRSTLARWETGASKPHASQRERWVEVLLALQAEVAAS